jgi:hypothetical protein
VSVNTFIGGLATSRDEQRHAADRARRAGGKTTKVMCFARVLVDFEMLPAKIHTTKLAFEHRLGDTEWKAASCH